MVDETHIEYPEFPTAGYRARRWTRFERDLYEWMNRPEGKFVCWLAEREIARRSVAETAAASAQPDPAAGSHGP